MDILLIRHAQPEWSRDGIARNDPGLTERGREQAQRVADRLAVDGPAEELLVSTATRAQDTAAPIAAAIDPTPVDQAWLHEIRFPSHWDQAPAEEIRERMESASRRPRQLWWDGMDEASESFHDFHARVTTGLDAALGERGVLPHPDDPDHLWQVPDGMGRIVMVAHAGTNSVVLGHLLGIRPQPWEWLRFASAHASITVVRTVPVANGHIFSLQAFSDVAHLGDLVTS